MRAIFVFLHQLLLFGFTVHSLSPYNVGADNTSAAMPIQIFARSGSNVSFSCPVNETMANQGSVLWLGPFFNYTFNSTGTHIIDNAALSFNRLVIFKVSKHHGGNYSCFWNESLTFSWTLFVLDIPSLPSNLKLSAINMSAIFLQWKIKKEVPHSLVYDVQVIGSRSQSFNISPSQQELIIDGLDPYSRYFVLLTPHDRFGLGPEIFNNSICTAPGTPTAAPNVTLISLTNTSITLNLAIDNITLNGEPSACPGSYLPPNFLSGPFRSFLLAFETLFGDVINITLNNNETELFTINQLMPFTYYRVNVSVFNGHMFGPPSCLNFTTKEGLPDPPRLQVESRSTDSLRVSFTSSDHQGVVLGYLIKWAECSNSSAVTLAETKDAYFTLTGLRNATCYQLKVAAKTSAGLGNFSALTQDCTSCPDFSSPKMFNITALPDGIKVSWIYTDPPASPDGYHRFLACMKSTLSSITEDIIFNATFVRDGVFSYTFPIRGVNLLGGHEIALNFSVQSICLPRDCKIGWPCQALSNTSNVLQLDLDHLAEMFSRPVGFSEISDKAIGGIIGAVFAIFLMLCCVGALSIFYCRFSRVYKRRGIAGGLGNDFGVGGSVANDRMDNLRTPLVTLHMRRFEDTPHKPIPAERLAQHVANYHVDDDAGYQAEFEEIEQTVRTSWPTSVARLPDNMAKNRYTNVFPYDHTRVILKNGRKSDYINANYVDGFCRPRAFIAAQGPKDTTFDDFWQMVWDENSNIIVMISNFVERGRRKCDQYWPSSGTQTYDNISVQMLSENYLACYVARVFLVKNVKCKKFAKERIVRHYQYTDWRDFDVPLSPLPVLVFVKTTIKEWTPSRGPIIVHCSAGVGRTGTYICIESLIRQLDAEEQVNIRGFLEHIRQQRMKLVQTEQQYAFIHDALREYLLCPEHEISAMSFPSYVQRLRLPNAFGVSGLQTQFEICTEHLPRAYEFSEARKPTNATKNRLSNHLLPTDSRRVVLPSEGGVEGASYINASVVQGYHGLQEFIVTQHPIPGVTAADFWRMVWDKNSPFVIVLSSYQDDRFPDFWPIETHAPREIGWLRVGFCNGEEVSQNLKRYEFLLSSSREDYALTCQLWRLHTWPKSVTEEACTDFLKLHSVLVSNHASAANGSIIVVDDYGGNRAGIFVATNFLINQLTLSDYIDAYYIVKMLNLQRTGIFYSPADLDFIYSVMEQFLLEMQLQDDNSSFLGNEASYSAGYANLSLFDGKLLPPLTSNSKPPTVNGDIISSKSVLFPFTTSAVETRVDSMETMQRQGIEETESALELHSLTSDTNVGDTSISPSLIGFLTPTKRPLNNGFVVKETVLPLALPPPPTQSPPPWPPGDDLDVEMGEVDEEDDPTPTTSLVVEGSSILNLDVVGINDGGKREETELDMTV